MCQYRNAALPILQYNISWCSVNFHAVNQQWKKHTSCYKGAWGRTPFKCIRVIATSFYHSWVIFSSQSASLSSAAEAIRQEKIIEPVVFLALIY